MYLRQPLPNNAMSPFVAMADSDDTGHHSPQSHKSLKVTSRHKQYHQPGAEGSEAGSSESQRNSIDSSCIDRLHLALLCPGGNLLTHNFCSIMECVWQ